MNISTVNELIAALESAGELSIREQKFLKLAKAYQELAAENVALKAEQVRIFNSGYLRGHESTVEGYYVDIHQDDITTYHEDIVAEIAEEQTPATDRIVAGIKADGVESGIKTIMTMLNHQAPGVSDAINVLRVHSSELREGADK
ncbi:hypothetical protein RA297_01160 [Klebsiella pneumoniae subsp. pneumoniae]|uniref:hypothetical protein n=1 Tax=Klebsiella pneumoniae TaxID=573 RepID=UPI0027968826|nr:hypothetical protein [Klebsiella pneumoniae]MDQ1797543.1 hypothetical protein [Klebsiella pneumoniae subsp. pneumoniae]